MQISCTCDPYFTYCQSACQSTAHEIAVTNTCTVHGAEMSFIIMENSV